ncbi:hypothetical protein BD413DRAFT_472104, partial [Trametes elegans]
MTINSNTNTNTNTLAGAYAAVRMAPVAMTRHLDDPHALSAARALRPKTFLVYVESELDPPNADTSPGDAPPRRVRLSPIAPCLRARESAWPGATVDMCVPVFPNAYHPTRRAPLRPAPPGRFPYDNCYHWAGVALDVRVLAVESVVGEGDVVRLSEEERREMERHWAADRDALRVG